MRGSRAVVGFNVESTVLRDTAEPRCERKPPVEHLIPLHIEKLPEGLDLATGDEGQGLVAQGRTIQETVEIARDVARRLIESQAGSNPGSASSLRPAHEEFDDPLIVTL